MFIHPQYLPGMRSVPTKFQGHVYESLPSVMWEM